MKTGDEIAARILERIGRIYEAPQSAAYTLGELEALLNELHWLYADAVDRVDDYVRHFPGIQNSNVWPWRCWREQHLPFDSREQASEVIARWQQFDAALGVRPQTR